MRRILLFGIACVLAGPILSATTLRVPGDQSTVQGAINAASKGDTVLVAEGTYFENINFRGKSIVVTSRYFVTRDTGAILRTILDGSLATNLDSASTVLLVTGEDSAAVLQGFTITGGSGSKYTFSGMGSYQEGGGIMLSGSSATIRDNVIVGNRVRGAGVIPDGGGGGISSMYGNPTICNNIVALNRAPYAAGIVLNWSGGKVHNNFIVHNSGGESYGAGGIMIWKVPANSAFVENNTIVGNISAKDAGGINITIVSAWPQVRNNIVWRNRQKTGGEVLNPDRTSYNLIEDYASGTNFSQNPMLLEHSLTPAPGSPCIDAGDTAGVFNDFLFPPSQGGGRNDIGATGGPLANLLPSLDIRDIYLSASSITMRCTAGAQARAALEILNPGTASLTVDSIGIDRALVSVTGNFTARVLGALEHDSLIVSASPPSPGVLSDTIRVYHRAPGTANPLKIAVKLTVDPTNAVRGEFVSPKEFRLFQNYPNPFNPSTTISYLLPRASKVTLKIFDALGREIRILAEGVQEAGVRETKLDGTGIASGVYFCTLVAEPLGNGAPHTGTMKMMMMK